MLFESLDTLLQSWRYWQKIFVSGNEEFSIDTALNLLENDWYTEEDLY